MPHHAHAGQTYNASQQCKLVFGSNFEICSYMVSYHVTQVRGPHGSSV